MPCRLMALSDRAKSRHSGRYWGESRHCHVGSENVANDPKETWRQSPEESPIIVLRCRISLKPRKAPLILERL
jgi:hypothetical protein